MSIFQKLGVEAGKKNEINGSDQLAQIIKKIEQAAPDNSFHTLTASQIETRYGIKLAKREKTLWTRHRNDVLHKQQLEILNLYILVY